MDMKILFLFAIIGSSLAFSVDLNRALALPRNLCCLTTNAQTTCATQCSGKSCSATCTVRCGILMSTCGTYTCSSSNNSCSSNNNSSSSNFLYQFRSFLCRHHGHLLYFRTNLSNVYWRCNLLSTLSRLDSQWQLELGNKIHFPKLKLYFM